MSDLLAGTRVLGNDTPVTVTDVEDGQYDFTISSYGTATTAGTYNDCAVVFTAPTTGRVLLLYQANLLNSSTGVTRISPHVREGGVIGSGSDVVAATDANRVSLRDPGGSPNDLRAGAHLLLTGLTPGAEYNARLEHSVSGGTGTARWRHITAMPAT